MADRVGLDGFDFLKKSWSGVSPALQSLLQMDFKNMSLRDYVTLIGFVYTGAKTLYALYGMARVVKVHGVSKVMRPNLRRKFGEWAVVTGCCRSFGEAYVHELANAGLNIILLTTEEEQMARLAETIEKEYKVKTQQIIVDKLNQKDRYDTLEQATEGKEIGILMNNVSHHVDKADDFAALDSREIFSIISGNIIPTTMMTHMLLPQMIERGKGAVVIVAESKSGDEEEMILYSSIRSYLTHFADSLYEQYKDEGITIQCLTPCHLASCESQESLLVPSSATYAKSALSTLGYTHNTTGHMSQTLQLWLERAFPSWLRYWLFSSLEAVAQQQASDKLGIDLPKLEAKETSRFSGSLSAFLEGVGIET